MIEVGKWYQWQGWPESQEGRPLLVIEADSEYGVVIARWPNGLERVTGPSHLRGPIEPVEPGVVEPCLLCRGERMVPHHEPREGEPWIRVEVGRKPCPNCHELLPDTERA